MFSVLLIYIICSKTFYFVRECKKLIVSLRTCRTSSYIFIIPQHSSQLCFMMSHDSSLNFKWVCSFNEVCNLCMIQCVLFPGQRSAFSRKTEMDLCHIYEVYETNWWLPMGAILRKPSFSEKRKKYVLDRDIININQKIEKVSGMNWGATSIFKCFVRVVLEHQRARAVHSYLE